MVEHSPEEGRVVGSSPTPSTVMVRKLFALLSRYERHLSAAAMVGGFVLDNLYFGRIDVWRTQMLFAIYTGVCVVSMLALHAIETRAARGKARPRWRPLLPIATQFALGGFWSGFVIFYGRSAVFSASWPFMLVLLAIFLANEYFSKYHERLVFTSILFFFALYSYAVFAVPIYTGKLGALSFIESGAVAVAAFALFALLLRLVGKDRFKADLRRIRTGAIIVLLVFNISYFTNILPPLPLAAKAAGVYHGVWRVPGAYLASTEDQSWEVRYLGLAPTLHVVSGESLYAYTSVFAPTTLTTTIVHRWQWYDPVAKKWITKAAVTYPIVGGRDGGYKGYSAALVTVEGSWRVDVETDDGRLIARLPFTVVQSQLPPVETTITLE